MPPKGGWLRAAPTVAATPLTKTAQGQVAEAGCPADADNDSLTKIRGATHAALQMLQMLYAHAHDTTRHGPDESSSTAPWRLSLGILGCCCHGFCLRLELLAQHE